MTFLKQSNGFKTIMKRIIIFPGYYVPHIGGLETHVDEFAKYLSKSNYSITIFAPQLPKNARLIEHKWHRVTIIRYPAFEIVQNYPFPKLWNAKFWRLLSLAYSKDYDCVMTRTRFFFNSFIGLLFAKFRLKPLKLVHVEHGSDFVKLESKFKTFVAKVFDFSVGKLIFNNAFEIVAISKAVEKFVYKNFVNFEKKKIHLIQRGIDFEAYDKLKLDNEIARKFKNKIKFVYLGRLYKWKGVENTIKAIISLPGKIKDKMVFFIVGDGEDYKRLKQLAHDELNKTIVFFGNKEFKYAGKILKACDCYIHSSYPGGGLSNSVLQALYLKKWIIASPHEGADEVIIDKKNGFLLKDNSENSIKETVLRFINNKNKCKVDAKTYNEFVKSFDWNEIVKKYKEVLK